MTIGKNTAQMNSGLYLDYVNPQPDQFTLHDVAQGLSRECRFSGQTRSHYSVAQHSVLVSLLVPKEYAMAALVHDGSEAFMRDVSTPLKELMAHVYKPIENRMQGAIHLHVGLPRDLPEDVHRIIKIADMTAFATERAQLMPSDDKHWPEVQHLIPLDFKIEPMDEIQAKMYFIDRWVSIETDQPFTKQRDLWKLQQNAWEQSEAERVVAHAQESETFSLSHRPRSRMA